jgi:hypothetical protein
MSEAARAAVLSLLARRVAGTTICPSEAARELAREAGSADWRREMPSVHAAARQLAAEGIVRLTWRGEERRTGEGPYRIAHGDR